MNNIENILDLNASEIDELIQTLKEIEDLALSSDGLGQINMVIDLFENNLDGLYKKAMVEQVKVRKQTFIEVIEELRDRRIRLERYREFLQSGAGVKVVQNQDYINVNPKDDINNASDLELAIGTLIPRIQDDYDVIREADNEINELEAIIASKLRRTDGVCIPRATLDRAAEGLMNDKYIPHVLGGVDYYNQETDSNLELSQVQLDAIASLYWNTGDSILYYNSYEDSSDYITTTGIDDVGEVQWIQDQTVEFYSNIENANNAIASGDLEKATEDLDDAFSSLYNKGNPDALQKERIDDTINYYMNNDEWETRFEIDDEK